MEQNSRIRRFWLPAMQLLVGCNFATAVCSMAFGQYLSAATVFLSCVGRILPLLAVGWGVWVFFKKKPYHVACVISSVLTGAAAIAL
ncbi:hypothetical protein B0H14DRAFT_1003076 [Mycena olivaceomarginata]|nr:hypothetical protein B0H14DRAFT_1003076 [Mycena olivaceomarginata]